MGKLTNYAELKLLNHALKVATFTRPAKLFLAFCTANPGEGATGGNIVEPSGAYAYARKECDEWSAAASRATAMNTVITFSTATGAWGILSYFALLDTATLATGNVYAYGAISPAKTITTGDVAIVDVDDLDVSWNAGGLSNYSSNKLLDHLLKNTPYTPPTNIWIALSPATINDNDTGTTITEFGQNYGRINHNGWHTASAGASSNSGTIIFAKATGATWGTISNFGLCDAQTVGNLLFHSTVTNAKQILIGDVADYADSALSITMD